jgi:hypothetical protein
MATVDTLLKAMELYAFKDISIQSPDQTHLPVHVDISAGLRVIGSTIYPTDFDFHNAVSQLFNQLRDAHTRYSMPNCYASFNFVPDGNLTFVSVVDSAVSPAPGAKQYLVLKDPSGRIPATRLSTLDGQDAVQRIYDWGVENGRDSSDLNTRFNQAIKAFSFRPIATYGFPNSQNVTAVGRGGSPTVVAPWVALATKDIQDDAAFRKLCLPASTEIRNGSIPFIDYLDDGLSFSTHEERLDHHKSALQRHIMDLHAHFESSTSSSSSSVSFADQAQVGSRRVNIGMKKSGSQAFQDGQVIYQTNNLIFSRVSSGVGALKMPSFFPSEFGLDTLYNIKSIPEFLFDFQRVTVLAQENQLNEIIIDLRGNGGGWICLAMELLRVMFPGPSSSPGTPPQGELFDIKSSPLLNQLATAASQIPRDVYSIFSPWKYLNPSSLQPYSDTTWLNPGIGYTRGGRFGYYSKMVTDDCSMVDIPVFDQKYRWDPSRVLVLTDGTCGSACALFARNLQERKQATTMTVGGIESDPMMVASFIGGLVYDLPSLLEELKLLKLSDSYLAPKPLPTSANLRFTLWEQYPWANRSNPPIPAEFVFEASDLRLMYTLQSVSNDQSLYADAYKVWRNH